MAIRSSSVFFFLFGIILTVSVASPIEKTQTPEPTHENDGVANGQKSHDTDMDSQFLRKRGLFDSLPSIPSLSSLTSLGGFTEGISKHLKRMTSNMTPNFSQSSTIHRQTSTNGSTSTSKITNIQNVRGSTQMHYDQNGVHIRMRSTKPNMNVSFRNNQVFVNDHLACSDINSLGDKLTYQKCPAGAYWHTNLKVGKPMTEEEIKDFEREYKITEDKAKETAEYWKKWGLEQKKYWKNFEKTFKDNFRF